MAVALHDLRAFMVDLDGVVYTGTDVIPGAPEFFALLRRRAIPFLLITNNSSRRPDQFASRLAAMGIEVEPAELLTSAQATAEVLALEARSGTRAFVIGEEGLRSALEAHGFTLVDDPAADYVVVGLDRSFDYRKLTIAIRAIQQGARFFGSNPDVTLPMEDGICPGAGSFQAAITACTGVKPVIIGKPEPAMLQIGLRRLGCPAQLAAMVGDRLDTDVVGAQRAGMVSVLVLTGITTPDEVASSAIKADYVLRDLVELGERLKGNT